MREIVIASGVRTPIGRFGGALKDISAPKLGAIVIREALRRAQIDANILDEVIMGTVVTAGMGQNPARQSAIFADVPVEVPAVTINKVCGSGLKAIMLASAEIKAGDAEVIVAGGMENMNQAPFLLTRARYGYRLGSAELVDAMVYDGLWDVYNDFHMGMTGEIIADRFNLMREEIDAFALRSHQRAIRAIREGKFNAELVAVEIPQKKGEPLRFTQDEGVREDTSLEKLSKLKPAFKSDGKITAGNASQISDGAAAVVVMSKDKAGELGISPLAKIIDYCAYGVMPRDVMYAPIPTVRKLLAKTGLTIDDIDLFEHNEAFASASLAVQKELNIPDDKFNVHGGAVALGHPIGCSGARVLVTLMYALKTYNKKRGLATLCLGGGNAVAMLIETI